MPAKKGTHKTVKNESCLEVSDWVTFLTSEKHGMISHILNFGVFLVVIVPLMLITTGNTVLIIASGVSAFGCVSWAYVKVLGPLRQRGKLADDILERIMSGELKNVCSIRKEWELGLSVIKRAWFRQWKARQAALKRTWRRRWKAGLAILKRARCCRGSSDK